MGNFPNVWVKVGTPKLTPNQRFDFALGRQAEREHVVKPPPDSLVQHGGVVGSGDNEGGADVVIDELDEGRHDPLQLTMFASVTSLSSERIEFVEQEDPRLSSRGLKDRCEVSRGLA
jgi:hypothetical protein